MKLIAMGVCMDDNSYLRDTWNQLDFFIVAASLFDMALSGSGYELQAFLCYMFGLLLLVFAVGLSLLRCFLCRGWVCVLPGQLSGPELLPLVRMGRMAQRYQADDLAR